MAHYAKVITDNNIGGRTNNSSSSRSTQGTDGTGSGGGGCTHNAGVNPAGGDGGDGVVVIRYAV